MTNWDNQSKNTSSFSNQSKNNSTFDNLGSSNLANLWASTVLPWQLALPWQYDTDVIDTVFTNQEKN